MEGKLHYKPFASEWVAFTAQTSKAAGHSPIELTQIEMALPVVVGLIAFGAIILRHLV